MNENELITYYNKFNEEKRLNSKYGTVEFVTTMHYLHKYLKQGMKIADIGAGTGRYSKILHDEGYDVTPVELIKHNLRIIEQKGLKSYQGNATNLSFLNDKEYDVVLLFGPLYHLINIDDRIKAINEAKRILKDDGIIMIVHLLNEYPLLTHGFIEKNILNELDKIDDNFKIKSYDNDLYYLTRIEEINGLNTLTNLSRIELIAQTGPAYYMRRELNSMNDEEFNLFIKYHLSTCNNPYLLGASSHLIDIVKKDTNN